MKIFIDTADIDEIRMATSWGIVDGATTNPSLIKKAVDKRGKITMDDYIEEIVKIVPGPVSLEVIALKEKEMIQQARLLYKKFSPYGDIAIKIPINTYMAEGMDEFEGLRTIKTLSGEGIPTNVTLIMNAEQALLAAKAGASYVSPFVGRIDDYVRTNMGMKRGVHFKKADFYDVAKVKRILENKILRNIKADDSIPQLYQSKDLQKILDMGHDDGVYGGLELVDKILKIYRNYDYKTEVLAASIRSSRQVRELAEMGVHVATIPFNVLKDMIRHYKTEEGVKSFTADIVPSYEKVFE